MKIPKTYAIIVAGGSGLRMGGPVKKQYVKINGIPILTRTLLRFDACDFISQLIVVVPKEDIEYCDKRVLAPFQFQKNVSVANGGKNRQESVINGFRKIADIDKNPEKTIVLVHDGVRPFATVDLIQSCVREAIAYGACIPAVRVTDTVKTAGDDDMVRQTLDRERLISVQTPQAFQYPILARAFSEAGKKGFLGTDDASLVEQIGQAVRVVEGSKNNFKITTVEDLDFARYLCIHGPEGVRQDPC